MKLRKISFYKVGLLALVLLVSACSRQPTSPPTLAPTEAPPAAAQPAAGQPAQAGADDSLARTDEQGQVVVVVTPLNLENPGQSLDFEVNMNTHSVDLGMDLSTLATLTTDTGLSVTATGWDAPGGGHHVGGTLSFPAQVDGGAVLAGAKTITITIEDVDAPERVFQWTLP